MSEAVLEVKNLSVAFATRQGTFLAVDGLSYTVAPGATVGIVGESGCGKTVAAYAVMGLLDPPGRVTGGAVRFRGRDLLGLPERERQALRGRHLAMIFQEPMTALNPVLTVGAQVAEPLRRHLALDRAAARARSQELLELVGVPAPAARLGQYPHELSGGLRQRVLIAMALACQPAVLIADEPTTAVDVTVQAQLLALLADLQRRLGMALVLITHDLNVVRELAPLVVVMYAGRTCEVAPAVALFAAPAHPYTAGLLRCVPRLGRRAARLTPIGGTVPSLAARPPGCPFHPRCPRATADCRAQAPPLTAGGAGRQVACFHPEAG